MSVAALGELGSRPNASEKLLLKPAGEHSHTLPKLYRGQADPMMEGVYTVTTLENLKQFSDVVEFEMWGAAPLR